MEQIIVRSDDYVAVLTWQGDDVTVFYYLLTYKSEEIPIRSLDVPCAFLEYVQSYLMAKNNIRKYEKTLKIIIENNENKNRRI